MRLTLRIKLLVIVGATALAFLLLIVAGALIANRVEEHLTNIQGHYVPKVELGPNLEGLFERLHRALQDAVAAHDAEALAATRELKNKFIEQLTAARDALNPADAGALRTAIDDYYAAAYEVSSRLIAGETGEALVDSMSAMQTRQTRVSELLRKTTAFDRRELIEAFSAVARAEIIARRVRLGIGLACMVMTILLSGWLSRGTLRSLTELTAGLRRFGGGDFGRPIQVASRDELGEVAEQANQMAESLKRLSAERDRTDWLKNAHAGLAQELRGELEPNEAGGRAISFLARYLDAPAGALFYSDADQVLRPLGQYAVSLPGSNGGAMPSFRPGEGLVGQAALQAEMTVIADPPEDYLRVRSGLGEGAPRAIALLPLTHVGKVTGVLELAVFKPWSALATELLLSVRETLTIAIEVARARAGMRELLTETQRQAERLRMQEEELRATNQELQAQQEEMQQTNEELRQQTEELDAQRRVLEEKNTELDDARRHLEQKAKELTTVSAYKSQFLANMSHELRTPLNSMLLLSNLLAENETGNLTDKQVQYSKTINSAGRDLLALINQVLDLAKVEAGKQEVQLEPVALPDLVEHAERFFAPLARHKGLAFVAEVGSGLPEAIYTDRQRVEQILNNLLANAIKFTERGEVAIRIQRPQPGLRFHNVDLGARCVAFAVSDTGLGIAPENQERVFAAFEQVDAASDRRYGGTGLGLSIARELALLLGGEIQLQSTPGKGSTFTCYLPYQGPVASEVQPPGPAAPLAPSASGRSANARASAPSAREKEGAALQPGDTYLLIIEDDRVFAETVGEVIHAQGLNYRVAPDAKTGLRLAKERKPAGILLDVKLPDVDGWTVMERLRADPSMADIPVHFVSALDAASRGMAMGAVGYLTKPVTRRDLVHVVELLAPQRTEDLCRVLVVEDDIATGDSLLKQLAGENLEVRRVTTAREALDVLKKEQFGCMILDLSLPDMDGLDVLQSLQEQGGSRIPSVVVYTARALSRAEAKRLEAYTEAIVLKEGPSAERLLNEIRLFTRRLKDGKRSKWEAPRLPPKDIHLEGKKILVVDDDMRTVYALSATLRAKGVEVLVADTGQAALGVLAEHSDVQAVLMDIMMPEMDGYEAMRRIRQDARFRALTIIALTAKAMKADKEKCLEAGASDYLPKPVDASLLLEMLQSRLSSNTRDGV